MLEYYDRNFLLFDGSLSELGFRSFGEVPVSVDCVSAILFDHFSVIFVDHFSVGVSILFGRTVDL
jgi:hypothetical protein